MVLLGLVGAALGLGSGSSALAAPGDLDPSFGSGGQVIADFGSIANGVALQPDGKLVVAGRSTGAGFAVARYLSGGTLDPSFGSGGEVTTVFGVFDVAFGVAIQSDGKIVAVGETALDGYCCQFALARYNTDGSLDTSFGDGGQVTTRLGGDSEARAVAIQSDGKLVVVGWTYSPVSASGAAIARYNTNGSLDTSFGTDGTLVLGVGDGYAVAMQSDGKIVVAGHASGFALAQALSTQPSERAAK